MAGGSHRYTTKFVLIFGICVFLLANSVVLAVFWPTIHRGITEHELLTSGRPATGVILSLTDTGGRVNMMPVMLLKLQVTTPDGTVFQSSAQEIVSPANVAALQPSQTVSVRYNPADERVVAIAGAGS